MTKADLSALREWSIAWLDQPDVQITPDAYAAFRHAWGLDRDHGCEWLGHPNLDTHSAAVWIAEALGVNWTTAKPLNNANAARFLKKKHAAIGLFPYPKKRPITSLEEAENIWFGKGAPKRKTARKQATRKKKR